MLPLHSSDSIRNPAGSDRRSHSKFDAEALGIGVEVVKEYIEKLKNKGLLQRVGETTEQVIGN
jgi:hypothetical protein